MNSSQEFVPVVYIARILRWWWLVAVVAIAGGMAGLIVHRFKPPQYEAQAIYMASIDFNKIDFMHPPTPTPAPYQLTQYDEDIALVVVESSLRAVIPQVVSFANQKGLAVDGAALMGHAIIERHHGFWYLRFRGEDPLLVQEITNYWADAGYANLLEWQKSGKVPAFVFFELVQKADLPKSPTFFGTNSFVLAGAVIGLVAGLLLVNLPFFARGSGS